MSQTTVRRGTRPWWVGLVSGMASYIDAAAIVSFGTTLVIYQSALGLTGAEIGMTSAALTFGIAVGAIVGGRLGDRFGRRPVFTITMVLIIAAALMVIFAQGFPIMFAAALLMGLASGADLPVSLSTISEAADDTNRGKLLGFSNLLWLAGSIVSSIGGGLLAGLGQLGGQILFIHIALVSTLVLAARLTIPESSNWLAAREERRLGVRTVRADSARFSALLRSPYRAPFLALIVFYALTNLAANTGGQFGAYLLVNIGGVDLQTATLVGLPLIPVGIVGYLWFMKVADSPKRFTYFVVGAAFWVVSQLVLAVFGISLTTFVISSLLGIVGTSFAFEGIMKVWSQEQFPTLLRTTAQGSVIAASRFLAAILASVTPLIVAYSASLLYFLLALMIAIGCGTAWFVFRKRDQHNEFDSEAELETVAA